MYLTSKADKFCKSIGDKLISNRVNSILDEIEVELPNGKHIKEIWQVYYRKRQRIINKYGIKVMRDIQDFFTYDYSLREMSKRTDIPKSTLFYLYKDLYNPYTYQRLLQDKKEFFK